VTVADFVMAYTLDWAGEAQLLEGFPRLREYVKRMYARPKAPMRIAEAFASIRGAGGQDGESGRVSART